MFDYFFIVILFCLSQVDIFLVQLNLLDPMRIFSFYPYPKPHLLNLNDFFYQDYNDMALIFVNRELILSFLYQSIPLLFMELLDTFLVTELMLSVY